MPSPNAKAWLSLAVLGGIMALVLFGGVGTPRYWQAWLYLVLFIGLSGAITADLERHDPALLERRLKGGPTAEPRPLRRVLMLGASLGFLALLLVPALDFRFRWSSVPLAAVLVGDALFLLGFGFIARVYRENTFTSATVEVVEDQRVISTGRMPSSATRCTQGPSSTE